MRMLYSILTQPPVRPALQDALPRPLLCSSYLSGELG